MENLDYEKMSVAEFAKHKVDKFCADADMPPYRLGLEACKSSNFYDRLVRGKCTLATIAEVEGYMQLARDLMQIDIDMSLLPEGTIILDRPGYQLTGGAEFDEEPISNHAALISHFSENTID